MLSSFRWFANYSGTIVFILLVNLHDWEITGQRSKDLLYLTSNRFDLIILHRRVSMILNENYWHWWTYCCMYNRILPKLLPWITCRMLYSPVDIVRHSFISIYRALSEDNDVRGEIVERIAIALLAAIALNHTVILNSATRNEIVWETNL